MRALQERRTAALLKQKRQGGRQPGGERAPHLRTPPHRTAPHRTAPHRTAPHTTPHTCTSLTVKDVTMPKLPPPPPHEALNRSEWVVGLATRTSPRASTIVSDSSWSQAMPCSEDRKPTPPPGERVQGTGRRRDEGWAPALPPAAPPPFLTLTAHSPRKWPPTPTMGQVPATAAVVSPAC